MTKNEFIGKKKEAIDEQLKNRDECIKNNDAAGAMQCQAHIHAISASSYTENQGTEININKKP